MSDADASDGVWRVPVVMAGLVAVAAVLVRLAAPVQGIAPPTETSEAHDPVVSRSGSEVCADCHASAHTGWARSTHAQAERPLSSAEPLSDGTLSAVGPDGLMVELRPVRSIGVEPLWQYLVPSTVPGALQVTQAAWDPAAGEWFDIFDDDRQPGEWGHWTGGAMIWNSQCARCHNTDVGKGWDEAAGRYDTTVAEVGVGCAACHGDLSAHAQGGAAPEAQPSATVMETCAACHARRAELTGKWTPGEPFADHHAPTYVDGTDTYWADGQVRDEDFEYSAFRTSRMFAAGVTCVDCHDAHGGELVRTGDALCLGCHEALPNFEAHDRHPQGSRVACVDCHMPVTSYMQRDPRHDHGFRIPDPSMTAELGIPSACDRCHDDLPMTVRASSRWWPDGGRAARERTRAVVRARAGDGAAVAPLIRVVADDPVGSWRATAATLLAPWVDQPSVRQEVLGALADADPWVRFAAAGSLAAVGPMPEVRPALERARVDAVRAVRVEAQRSLRGAYSPDAPEMAEYVAYLDHNSDQPAALHERATWALELGQPEWAEDDLRRAIALDPSSPMLHEALGVALAATGQSAEALAALQAAVALSPDDPELTYRLALAHAGVGELAAARDALQRTTTFDPAHDRAWYNLGVLEAQEGETDAALRALERARVLVPRDVEVLYAVASTLHRAGRADEATAAAQRVLAVAPDHRGAVAIVGSGGR